MDPQEKTRVIQQIEQRRYLRTWHIKITPEMSDDVEIMLALIKKHIEFWYKASERVKSSKEFCIIAVEKSPKLIEQIEGDLLKDIDIANAALRSKAPAIDKIFECMEDNVKEQIACDAKILINELRKGSGKVTKYANEELKNNRKFALEAVKYDRDALRYLNKRFRDDIEIVIKAIECKPDNFLLVSPTLQKNKTLAIFALRKGGKIFPYLDEKLRGDRDVVEAAIEENGIVIEFASEELKNDPELREKAKQTMLRQIEELPHDKSFHIDIINSNCPESMSPKTERGIADVAEKWIKDKSFMKEAVARNALLLGEFYPNNLCEERYYEFLGKQTEGTQKWEFDETLAVVAVDNRSSIIKCLYPHIRERRDVLIQAAKSEEDIFKYLTEEQKRDEKFMIELLKASLDSILLEKIKELFPEDAQMIEGIYERELEDKYENMEKISTFNNKVRDIRKKRRDISKKRSVSIIVRDEVTKQERKVDILLAVLLDKRAQLMGYNHYGEQRKCEANNKPVSYIPTEEEQNEIKQITQQIEELEGRETNE